MAIRRVIKMGHPLLRKAAIPVEPVEIGSERIERLIVDMGDTLHDYGGIGLAAPQVAEPIRLALVEVPGGLSRYGELASIPLTVFINPIIEVLDPATAGYWEGCLSVPGIRGFVERPQHVKVSYTSRQGEPCVLELQGFSATVLQHELDHLDGILFLDRVADTHLLAFEAEYERYILPTEDD